MVNDDRSSGPARRSALRSPRRRRLAALAAAAALTVSGLVAAGAPAAAAAKPVPTGSAPTGSALQRAVDGAVAAGAAGYVARVDDGRHVSTAVAGLADRAEGRRLRADDEFEIGSNTKTFMATLALQLVARGELRLTDTVEQHLPGVVPNGNKITVRMLLNHTSGIFNYTQDETWGRALFADPQTSWRPDELVAIATKHKPVFAPGTSWSYSNTNYVLVGMILEEVTGRTPGQLLEHRIARPLGLQHTYLLESTAEDTGRGYAHGYMVTFGKPGTAPRYTDVSDWNLGGWAYTAGAMISTPEELGRFFTALLRGELLPAAQLTEMKRTVALPASVAAPSSGYGLGLMKIVTPCGTVWGHGGDTLGHHSTALVSPDGRRSAIADTSTQLDQRVAPDVPAATKWARAVGTADATAVCAMYGKALPTAAKSSAKAA
jgi:D-alanyl-D-alanine carboxypeptidase